ncbi:MAG: hypothetical protein ACYC3K_12740 [Candidatus Nanopelagicales bacterium]
MMGEDYSQASDAAPVDIGMYGHRGFAHVARGLANDLQQSLGSAEQDLRIHAALASQGDDRVGLVAGSEDAHDALVVRTRHTGTASRRM